MNYTHSLEFKVRDYECDLQGVVNNGVYGKIRMHQQRDYPDRPSATTMLNPDFAALATCYGCNGEVVTETQDFEAAFARAQSSEKSTIIELRTDPAAVSPRTPID